MSDIRINQQQWDAVSPSDQEAITKGLRESGALKAGDSIVGDSAVPQFDKNTQFEPMWNPLKDLCKVACDTAAAAGIAWCAANTGGVAMVACIAAAEAARNECRNHC